LYKVVNDVVELPRKLNKGEPFEWVMFIVAEIGAEYFGDRTFYIVEFGKHIRS
jgi:hypothetical protein